MSGAVPHPATTSTEAAAAAEGVLEPRSARRSLPAILVAAALSLWQLWASQNNPPGKFMASYWLVSYDFGFVRRGLNGEINQALFGTEMGTGSVMLAVAVGLISVVPILALAWALVLRADPRRAWFGVLLLASPFTVRSMAAFDRPDQLGFFLIVLVWLATTVQLRRARLLLLAASGAFAAIFVLMHEGVFVSFMPWLALLLVTSWPAAGTSTWKDRVLELGAAFVPAAISAAAVIAWGLPSKAQAQALREAAEPYLIQTKVSSVLDYLGEGVKDSIKEVLRLDLTSMSLMVGVGLAFFVVHLLLARACGVRLLGVFATTPAKLLGVVLLAAFGFQLATGFDWSRWMTLWTTNWLLATAVMLLRGDAGVLVRRAVPAPGSEQPASTPVFSRRRVALLVGGCLLLGLVPQSPPYNLDECSYTYIAAEWTVPFQRVADMASGTSGDYERERCGNLGAQRAKQPR